ncbi:hypothetical protein KLP28_14000 [Nocardioidaceae bacterium]|nr:hypothetical protein KLP28_14000 [Nocardioidaceae bacterium]
MSEIVLPRRRAHGCCGEVWMPALTSDEVDVAYVRRAVLPWRRRVTPTLADCLADRAVGRWPTGWRRPVHWVLRLVGLVGVLVLLVPALLELLIALAVLPLVKQRRRSRGEWPVQLVVGGAVRHVELCPTEDDAHERAFALRMELIHLEPYESLVADGIVGAPASVHRLDERRDAARTRHSHVA